MFVVHVAYKDVIFVSHFSDLDSRTGLPKFYHIKCRYVFLELACTYLTLPLSGRQGVGGGRAKSFWWPVTQGPVRQNKAIRCAISLVGTRNIFHEEMQCLDR